MYWFRKSNAANICPFLVSLGLILFFSMLFAGLCETLWVFSGCGKFFAGLAGKKVQGGFVGNTLWSLWNFPQVIIYHLQSKSTELALSWNKRVTVCAQKLLQLEKLERLNNNNCSPNLKGLSMRSVSLHSFIFWKQDTKFWLMLFAVFLVSWLF